MPLVSGAQRAIACNRPGNERKCDARSAESGNLKKFAVVVEKTMRTLKIADRNPMRDQHSQSVAGNPRVQMKCRRFDRKRRWQARVKIQRDGVIGSGAYGGRRADEIRQRGAVHVPRRD